MRQARPKLWALFLILLAVSAACAETQSCPWLNAATAAGVLEGAVTVSVTHFGQDNTDAACEFTVNGTHGDRMLRIEVDTMKDPPHDFPRHLAKCAQGAEALKAIGNEAIVCAVPRKNYQVDEQVVSRVRDRAFIVNVLSNSAPLGRDAIREKARTVAEQVAGFLF